MKEIEKIICTKCGYEIATVTQGKNELLTLEVPQSIQLKIIDKEKNIGIVICPKCGFENQTTLSFWSRF